MPAHGDLRCQAPFSALGSMKDVRVSLGKQLAIVLLILLALTTSGYWYVADPAGSRDADAATTPKRAVPTVEIAPAERTRLVQRIEAVGTTRARRAIDIRPATSGQVVEIEFLPGSLVTAGELLARLDDAAERADVAESAAELRKAGLELERAIKLAARKTIAQATVDELEAAHDAAKARLLRTEKALEDRGIIAPFAGQVGLKQVTIGTRVDDDTVITTLDDLAEIQVDFSVPEIFFGQVRSSQRIKATGAAFGDRSFEGEIETVDSRIDRVSRSFKVRARIPNPDLILPTGMFMLVDLTLLERDALSVPEEAIMVSNDEAYVFVITDGKAARRLVTLGQRDFGKVEIVDGLSAGDKVVTRGLQRVRDGAEVTIGNDRATGKDDQESQPATTVPNA